MEEKPKVKPEVYRPPKVAPQHFGKEFRYWNQSFECGVSVKD